MKLMKFIFSRMAIFGIILIIQVGWAIWFILDMGNSQVVYSLLFVLSLFCTIWIVYRDNNPAYKLAWIVPILVFPLFGGLLYLAMGDKKPSKRYRKAMEALDQNQSIQLRQDECVMKQIEKEDPQVASQMKYLSYGTGYPVYQNTESTYYTVGEEYYEALLCELSKAKHYIFMEYFIVENGKMWQGILDILVEKAKEGIDVRFIYDDVGCLSKLPFDYWRYLEKLGIKCISFNPFVPFVSVAMNNRDHRKICVIDGHTGFTGGINLADEYINEIQRFGHWKDTGIMLKGNAVWSLTVMFLRMWNINRPTEQDFAGYHPSIYMNECIIDEKSVKGYVQPYADSPLDGEITGENVYLNIIYQATKYVYIMTPYLIIDYEMNSALCLAAKRGVDVRIITPGIPDKKIVFGLTRSYYPSLMEAGVKIYEYTPGFLHAKCFVSDDNIATVGTINMDYRSLYLHFECGVLLNQTDSVLSLKNDFIKTMGTSHEVSKEMNEKGRASVLFRAVLRLFAPLL